MIDFGLNWTPGSLGLIFLCLTYVTPDKSCHQSSRDNVWNLIRHEIANFTTKGHIMLIGDFNARTGTIPDYIMFDSVDHVPVPPDYTTDSELQRFSKYCICNNYGRELLDLCKASHLRLINGRFGEDKGIGSFTCYTSRGQSTVDYHVFSESLLPRITNFVIDPPSDLSDH